MVGMVMRVEDVTQAPAMPIELGKNRRGIGRIDRGSEAGLRVVQQESVVVAEARKLRDFQLVHGGSRKRCA